MPIYEYRCESCGAELEKLRKISDPPLVECPACGKHTLVKQVSASSFRLKGSGWYETDFKTGKKKNGVAESPAEAATSSGTSNSDAGKTEAKSDAKSDAGASAATTAKPAASGSSAAS